MKKIAPSKFSGEKDGEEDIVLAGDYRLPLVTNYNNQQVHWYGRRVIHPSILEQNCLSQASSSNQTHEVGAPSTSYAIPAPAVVYKPTPLRCVRRPTVDFNGIHIPTGDDQLKVDQVDTTLRRMSNYGPRNSDVIKKSTSNNLMPDLGRLRHDFYNDVGVDDVDTVLSLRLPGTSDPKKKSRLQEKGKGKALDHNPTGDMSNLGCLRPGFFGGDEVDTTSSLRPPGTVDPNGKKRKAVAGDTQRKKASKPRNIGEDENSRPLIPIGEIPTLMKAVESRNGSRPLFLYRKILKESDRKSDLNRLFVTRSDGMMGFLRAEEKAAVDTQAGVTKIVGVDSRGNVYNNLVVKTWPSMTMKVINSDWRKVVEANKAEAGDVVEIWGFRVDEKPCLAFNFRKQLNAAGASTSGTSSNDEGSSMA